MHKTLFVTVFLLWHILCIKDFENLEICSSYRNYTKDEGSYGQKGVPSSENYPSVRNFIQATYSKKTNTLWIFGGEGIGVVGEVPLGLSF